MPISSALHACGITGSEDTVFDFSVIEGPYLRDILDQPRALDATLENLTCSDNLRWPAKKLGDGQFRRIVLTGMGSSFHALHPTNIQLIAQGFTPAMVETSELVHYQQRLFDPSTLIIAVSQSGESAEVLRLLEMNENKSALIGVTNTADSPLAKRADATMLTRAGTEFSVSCKTYVAALLALQALSHILCSSGLSALRAESERGISAVEKYLESWDQHVDSFAHLLDGTRQLFLVGRGPSLAAVGTGALIVKESDHFAAEGMSSAAFRHGPFEMLGPENFVLVFDGDEPTRNLNRRLLQDIRRQHGRAELVGSDVAFPACKVGAAPASVLPILEILPVQMLTLALAAQTGREPGRFERATKVTTTE
jgi:glutamine---fructose-6-phosphate transaminase (isomerizing)